MPGCAAEKPPHKELIPARSRALIIAGVRFAEGAFMRRHDSGTALTGPISGKPDVGDAVPAGRGKNASLAPGRRGAPPGGTRTPRQELADGSEFSRLCRKRGPRRKDTAMERRGARRAHRLSTSRTARCGRRWLRFAALHLPRCISRGKRDRGVPGARQRIRAAERWLSPPHPERLTEKGVSDFSRL